MKNYQSTFKAINGNNIARFTFNYRTKLGTVTLSWMSFGYPVYDGKTTLPPLIPEVNLWLKSEWEIATRDIELNVYRGKNLELNYNRRRSWLLNGYCPICLEKKSIFNGHHCIARSDGGRNGYQNVLEICATCHAMISFGCFEDRWVREDAALYHQFMHFGLDPILRESYLAKYEPERDLYDEEGKELLDSLINFNTQDESNKEKLNQEFKDMGRFWYQYNRDMALGLRPFKKELLHFPRLNRFFRETFNWLDFPA